MPSPPSYIMPALLFHPDPKAAVPLPSPISILAVPASLYLLYFSILLAYAAAFVPPQHTSLLLLRDRPCIPLSRKFPFFFLFNRPPGVLHCLLSSPYCPALYSPVAKVSLLFSFQPPPRCAPLFPFLSVLPGFALPRHESFFASFFSKKEGALSQRNPFPAFLLSYFIA